MLCSAGVGAGAGGYNSADGAFGLLSAAGRQLHKVSNADAFGAWPLDALLAVLRESGGMTFLDTQIAAATAWVGAGGSGGAARRREYFCPTALFASQPLSRAACFALARCHPFLT